MVGPIIRFALWYLREEETAHLVLAGDGVR